LGTSLQVPVLETPDGPVFESNAIARYGNSNVATIGLFSVLFAFI
jgi:hypothetical protein